MTFTSNVQPKRYIKLQRPMPWFCRCELPAPHPHYLARCPDCGLRRP